MQIRIPNKIVKACDAIHEWGYTPIFKRGRITIRRIDPYILGFGIFCTAYYWWYEGWIGALKGALMYIFVSMIALWL